MSIFINYRRGLSDEITGRIDDRLRKTCGKDAVFRSIDGLSLGIDFESYIYQQIARSDVLLVLIGPDWQT